VRCNEWLKFGRLHEYARRIDARFVASGHYARVDRGPDGRWRLRRGVDRSKDQSYVLFGAEPQRLAEMLLPLGDLCKSQVRHMARAMDLPVSEKPDSQEICFVQGDYAGLLRERAPGSLRPGRIVDTSGRDLGGHGGHQLFTVGQRRGLGIAAAAPLYVVEKDTATNTVTVGARESLHSVGCVADEAAWLVDAPGRWTACGVKVRSHGEPVPAQVRSTGAGSLEVLFESPQFAVAPGQAVVCYTGDVVMGGGWIRAAIRA
jgi:tRNA-specific 2-thiouridylase